MPHSPAIAPCSCLTEQLQLVVYKLLCWTAGILPHNRLHGCFRPSTYQITCLCDGVQAIAVWHSLVQDPSQGQYVA